MARILRLDYSEMMKPILLAFVVVSLLLGSEISARSQGLIGMPCQHCDIDEFYANERKLTKRLELERAKLFHRGLNDASTKAVYGSILLELAGKYESLQRWQDAVAAVNSLKDLNLSADALSKCPDCLVMASNQVINIDFSRINSKIAAVESVHHIRIDPKKRLPIPAWGSKERLEYASVSHTVSLPRGVAMSLDEFLGK